jgi:hypothetical protein
MVKLTCHICYDDQVFHTWHELTDHRDEHHTEWFVGGIPFWMLEIKVPKQDYYWIARQMRDKPWLEAWP